jgi:hypothetical protein
MECQARLERKRDSQPASVVYVRMAEDKRSDSARGIAKQVQIVRKHHFGLTGIEENASIVRFDEKTQAMFTPET